MSLDDNLKDDHWLSRMDYMVKYYKNNLLAIWLTAEGVGAYPDETTKYLVFDLRDGKELKIEQLFDNLPGLRNLIRQRMRSRENTLNREMKAELKLQRREAAEAYPTPERLEVKDLAGFAVNDRGVTFIYDYDYPQVSQALEPSGSFSFTYGQLRPFIRRDGLLARFVR
ncbi:MAG TPA: hypothetical protein VEV84_04395, partial [Pyrinomonadaceae bacterium]|nr:hypothetical protein [Pyrinomonadaceae bacterium]